MATRLRHRSPVHSADDRHAERERQVVVSVRDRAGRGILRPSFAWRRQRRAWMTGMSDRQVEFARISEPEGNQGGQFLMRDGVGAIVDSIPMTLRIVLGSVTMPIRDVTRLRPGSLVTLDRRIGEPVEIAINDRVICRGHISVSEEPSPRFVIKIVDFVERQDSGRSPA